MELGETTMKRMIALIFAASLIAVLSACGGGGDNSSADEANAREIVIKASNYKFDQETYVVKKGEPIKLVMVNEQGNHGIEIKDFKVKVDARKSQVFTPNKTGEFDILCSIMCGPGHDDMVSKLIVEE